MRPPPVLEKIDALPGANRNGQRRLRQRRLDVRGHVVGAFGAMNEEGIAVRHEPLEKRDEIALHVGIGVFLDQKRCRGVAAENMREPGFNPGSFDDLSDSLRKFGELTPSVLIVMVCCNWRMLEPGS